MATFHSSLCLLSDHVWLGVLAAVLFVAGLGTAGPVVRHDYRPLMALPLWVVRLVLRVMGPNLPPLRTFALIFGFNCVAIFLYMLSGVLIVVPAAMAFLTGLHIGVVVLKAGELDLASGAERPPPPVQAAREGARAPAWVNFCGLLVLLLELPSFWISVGMGIGMARKLSAAGQYNLDVARALVTERVDAYLMIIIPALFLSALAETAAIRGNARSKAAGPQSQDDAEA